MNKTRSTLNGEELFHLGLEAMKGNNSEAAIEYLKRSLELNGDNPKAAYLLGAMHAQIGMYDRAIENMKKAIELEPGLSAARFQLGLLHLTSARVQEAMNVWQPLELLGPGDPYYLFKQGLEHLARDEFEQCQTYLREGIAANQANPALNVDMQRIMNDVTTLIANNAHATAEQPAEDGKHLLISAYTNEKR